ncbi:MAG: hypothetical protein SFY66_18680 [Oculatellaceae cyanobacterium bins.114]|nr:hypothetical protein [Oculatellaceae cyanobacterium bins.114]
MALIKPLVIINGLVQQLSAADTLDAAVSEVDVVSLTNNQGTAVVIGTPVYSNATGQYRSAQANASGTVQVIGLAKDVSVANAASGLVQTDGVMVATTTQWDAITGQTGGLTAGSPYFLSASTAGRLTVTAPSTVGQFVVRVGIALSATQMDITVQPPIGL